MWKVAVVAVLGCSSPGKKEPVEPPTPVETAPKPVEPAPAPDPEPIEQPTPPQDLAPLTNADLESPQRPKKTGSQAAIAWAKNEDGIKAMKASKYSDASASFRDAVAREPLAAYFFNLCVSLYFEGKFGEALTACNAVENVEPTATQRTKTAAMMTRIKDEAARQKIEVK